MTGRLRKVAQKAACPLFPLPKLEIKGEDFEKRVLQGGTDAEIAEWVKANGKHRSDEEKAEWNTMVLTFGPKATMAQQAFDRNLAAIAEKRGVPIEQLAYIKTWFELIEPDEGRK